MQIEKIAIKNFKGVKDIELEFTSGVNLLIGDNGVGKSSILEAIAIAIFRMLRGIKGVPTKNISQEDIRFSFNLRGDASSEIHYETPVEIVCQMKAAGHEFCWKRYRMDENTPTKDEDNGIAKWMQEISNNSTAVLPLLCFQSDARIWQKHRGNFGKELKRSLNDRRCGYIGCLDYSMDIRGIQAWCLKMELNAFQKKQEIKEYESFKKIVALFMKKISSLEVEPEIYYSTQLEQLVYREEEADMPISVLSAGYQSLLWMVMNLAYRVALLNPDKTMNLDEITGVVLIDEIDMHLHPKWQWNIVNALEETFPNIQFILVTHSPIVISSCKNEHLILIDEEQKYYLENAYGYSVQDVLNFRQGTAEKPAEIKKLFKQFYDALDNEELEQAEEIITKMTDALGKEHDDVKGAREELKLNCWEDD